MNQAPKPRRRFDEVFKREAVNHWLSSGRSAETIALELGLKSKQIYAWKKRFAPQATNGKPVTTLAEAQAQLAAAQREIRHLRDQRDILKKTLGILSEPLPNASNPLTK
jgi:transposase